MLHLVELFRVYLMGWEMVCKEHLLKPEFEAPYLERQVYLSMRLEPECWKEWKRGPLGLTDRQPWLDSARDPL